MNKKRIICVFILQSIVCISVFAQKDNFLWYTQAAKEWSSEALPIGNGRVGAMIFGGINQEHIQFNEQSLWSGENNWDGEYETGDHGFGSYRNFGDIYIDFNTNGNATNYRRSLNITKGVYTSTYEINKVKFTREAFASHPAQIMIFRFSASKSGGLTGKIGMKSAQGAASIAANEVLSFEGTMPNLLKYAAQIKIEHQGGIIRAEKDKLIFEKCNSIILYVDARTNYKPDFDSGWRGVDPMPLIQQEILNAQKFSYKQLFGEHIKDISSLLQRVSLNLGTTSIDLISLPTNERLKRYEQGADDPELEVTMFQYGRYLLASCSRPGGLPANLQGLWNDSNEPAWASDYHNNINVQMNYWGAETTNLSECQIPLIDFVFAATEPCRVATRKAFGKTRGWTARTSQSIFGGNGWEWNIPASAWYAHHLFEHWDFTQDTAYLKDQAYPMIKEICEYWEDNLKKLPDGTLVVPNGWSPEHGPREDGVMHDQQLVWDLFQNYLDAAKTLNIDKDYQLTVADMQKHLAPNKIGKWGQLQEWQTDRDDPNDEHRHSSHLFAVYPGRQISLSKTPELAKAAIISLRGRSGNYGNNANKPFTVESTIGDSRRSWTWPWRCALWARLGEGEKAGIMVRGLLKYNTLSNLFCSHPPFQMDGNFGISGAIPEMLLQSDDQQIILLPAIPQNWAKKGSFSGLCARGGYTLKCSWKNGKVTSYKIKSKTKKSIKVMINGKIDNWVFR